MWVHCKGTALIEFSQCDRRRDALHKNGNENDVICFCFLGSLLSHIFHKQQATKTWENSKKKKAREYAEREREMEIN